MKKLLDIQQYFADTYEPSIQFVDRMLSVTTKTASMTKVANEAWEYIQTVKPSAGKRFILVIAMGAGEFWGNNKNGDYFPEKDLLKSYRNFETTFDNEGKINGGALVFKHHKNKLHLNHPWFGLVRKSFYNPIMHRVELLLEILEEKCAELVAKVDSGCDIAVSMGVRIPYDTCSICGNKAAKRENYCDHLKFMLRRILPGGKKVYAINGGYDYAKYPKPLNFFDISIVFRPADPTGWMLKKVAEHDGETIGSAEAYDTQEFLREKIAVLKKFSEIDKVIRGVPMASVGSEAQAVSSYMPTIDRVVSQLKPLSDEQVTSLSAMPLNKVLSTLAHHNIILSTPEFLALVLTRLLNKPISPQQLRPLAAAQAQVFDELSEQPEKLAEMASYDMFQDVGRDGEVEKILGSLIENRDLSERGFVKKAGSDLNRSLLELNDRSLPWGDGKGMLHSETVTDPVTGKKFIVNHDAIEDGQFYKDVSAVAKSLATAMLLGGAYYALKNGGAIGKTVAPLAGIGGVALGLNGLKDVFFRDEKHGYTHTDQGTPLGRHTMMIEKRGAVLPWMNERIERALTHPTTRGLAILGPAVAAPALGKYYEDRLQTGVAGSYADPLEQHLDSAGRAAYVHPFLSSVGGATAGATALHGLNRLRGWAFRR